MQLQEIRKILKSKSNLKAKKSTQKFVPTVKKQYGVKMAVLNEIVKKVQASDFELIAKLWKSGVFEERILASKILGKIGNVNSDKALKLIKKFGQEISNWVVCDTLATQGVRKIIKFKQKEIFKVSKKFIKSKNLWQRRFALVLLINFVKDKRWKKEIEEILSEVKNEKEYYVKKAIIWLRSQLKN
jgi:3-methyladenine DNA glycosylase AlkD